ncbi:hypothetical protein CEXT_448351 [Caerostris extrusa]|uniref:Uncharacterized protein n=1 Tax=Caerostris extrusa TaxID=172846 RepID=A0AAV4XI74_CAEEX|nr:hypothetical protein CEXT_448351 [Caerostris extrusa]
MDSPFFHQDDSKSDYAFVVKFTIAQPQTRVSQKSSEILLSCRKASQIMRRSARRKRVFFNFYISIVQSQSKAPISPPPPPLISTNPDRVIADVIPGLHWSRSRFHAGERSLRLNSYFMVSAIFYPDHTGSQTITPTKN